MSGFEQSIAKFFNDYQTKRKEKGYIYDITLDSLNRIPYAQRQGLPLAYRGVDADERLEAFENNELSQLCDILKGHPFFNGASSRMIEQSIGGSALSVIATAKYLQLNVTKKGLVKALADLNSILEMEVVAHKIVAVIVGASVKKAIKINNKILLAPLDDVPKSYAIKRLIEEISEHNDNIIIDENIAPYTARKYQQRCALIYDYKDLNVLKDESYSLDILDKKEELRELVYALSIIHPCVPFIELFDFIADHPALNCIEHFGGAHLLERPLVIPNAKLDSNEITELDSELLEKYLQIKRQSSQEHNKLRLALKTFVECRLTNDYEKRVIGLAICLECLLLRREADKKQHRLSLRCANILGTTEEDRVFIKALFTKFYCIRSDLVHSGAIVNQEYEVVDTSYKVNEIVTQIESHIPRIFQYFIREGEFDYQKISQPLLLT